MSLPEDKEQVIKIFQQKMNQHMQNQHVQNQHMQNQHMQNQHMQNQHMQNQHMQNQHMPDGKEMKSEKRLDLCQQVLDAVKAKDKQKIYELITEEADQDAANEETICIEKDAYILFFLFLAEAMVEEQLLEFEKAFALLNAVVRLIQLSQSREETVSIVIAGVFEFMKYGAEQEQNNSYHYLIVSAKEYIHNKLDTKINIAKMAEEIGTNASYLSRLFHQKEGITLQQYICSQRIEEAKKLLRCSELTIEEISKNLGFSSLSYFGKILKNSTGMTPNQYRLKGR